MSQPPVGSQFRANVRHLGLIFAAYTVVAAAATLPLVRHLGSHLAGDHTDAWQTVWGFWWWRHGATFGSSLMYSKVVWWPHGAPVWFQTWDIPSALVAALFWGVAPPPLLYNLLLLLTFPLSGVAFYLLARELWGGTLAPALAGCLYTFSTFHFANANAVLHISSMQWSPLYFLGLIRMCRSPSYWNALLAGTALAIATLASPYHLTMCAVGTCTLAAARLFSGNPIDVPSGFIRRVALSSVVFACLAGWLLVGMSRSYLAETYVGAHPADKFSADLLSFLLPNRVSIWSGYFTGWTKWTASYWTGTTALWADAAYIGYFALGLALLGLWWEKATRPFLAIAAVGAVLALGPRLQVGGVTYGGLMPNGLMSRVLPVLSFSGIPSRFSWLVTFGVAIAAGACLARLCRQGRRGCVLAIGVTALALLEVWPRPMVLSRYPKPPIFKDWAADRSEWAVLDATWWSRALWHQTLHGHPIIGGYLTRAPAGQWSELAKDPVLSGFFAHMLQTRPDVKPVSHAETLDRLVRLRVRFVIVDSQRSALPTGLGLIERYQGDGLAVFEVPDRALAENRAP